MSRNVFIWMLMMTGCFGGFAQKVYTAKGKAQVRLEDNLSMDEAKEKARQLAIINAIEDVYGTYVEQDASTYIENGETNFRIIGTSRVKGEWLKTLDESFDEIQKRVKGEKRSKKETWITCEIKGSVRELTKAPAKIKFLPLNCPDPVCRTYDFESGEPFYLYFSSPAKGFLSIYMAGTDSRVFCLLPYKGMNEPYINSVPVDIDKEYVFFAPGEKYNYFDNVSYQQIDEMVMEAGKDREVMNLYIIFSPTEYTRPRLNGTDGDLTDVPRFLDLSNFDQWLQDNRILNPDFNYNKVSITVTKK
jgi:hypothetical protein